MPPRRKPAALFNRSPYAINSTPDGELGCYGCVLLKPLRLRSGGWREGEDLSIGTIIPGHVAANWPIANRLAMKDNKYVRYFMTPDEAAQSGASIVETARRDPIRAAIDAEVSEEELARAKRVIAAANLAKARAAKALKAKEAVNG